jgi:dTDP-4-amino-4,6-dideoxygalactose transaminase
MTTKAIPMVDLAAQYARVAASVDAAMRRVVESTQFIKGPDCELFEQEFAAYCGAAHACGVANGTDAITLVLKALGVGAMDDVLTVAATFIGTAEAIVLNGARPVFVDIDPRTYTMDPDQVEAALTPRTKAILPVHLYGHPADMEPIVEIGRRHGIPVIEDAAQAHGAEMRGHKAGSMGTLACFSFYPAKNLGAYGDGGMVTSNDADLLARVRQLANHGSGAHKYDNVVIGTNSRLDTLQAAVLRVKLRHLEAWNAERHERAAAYTRALDGTPGLVLPREREGARSSWHLYTIRTADRDGLKAHLEAEGISTAVHYARPIHLQPAMAAAGGRPGDLPVSEQLCREVLCLPLYPDLPLGEVDRIAGLVRAFQEAAAVRG